MISMTIKTWLMYCYAFFIMPPNKSEQTMPFQTQELQQVERSSIVSSSTNFN